MVTKELDMRIDAEFEQGNSFLKTLSGLLHILFQRKWLRFPSGPRRERRITATNGIDEAFRGLYRPQRR